MNMKKWAEREIELACARERANSEREGDWEYGCACYESAFKAFKSLMKDGHSGYSIGFTKQILNRLIDGKVLTPIEDTDDIWGYLFSREDHDTYHCTRISSLFKDIYKDGTIRYNDLDRAVKVDINSPDSTWRSGLVDRIIDEMFPITMPYIPDNKPYTVYCEDILTEVGNGDYDTVGIHYLVKPDGTRVEINRYFKDGDDTGMIEIDYNEWVERVEMHNARLDALESKRLEKVEDEKRN